MEILRFTSLVAELCQGDILELCSSLRPYGCTAGVILTADCDLVQGKHYGHLLVCPILTAQEYFAKIWLPKKVARLTNRLGQEARRKLIMCDSRLGALSDEYLNLVIENEKSIRLVLQDANPSVRIIEDLISISSTLGGLAGSQIAIEAYVNACKIIDARPVEKLRDSMISEFRSHLTQDSNDIVVLPDMLTPSSLAHVVLLRSPFSIALSEVGEAFGEGVFAKRVASFESPVKFLIAQKFGYLFSRIGMPGTIEKERADCVSILEV